MKAIASAIGLMAAMAAGLYGCGYQGANVCHPSSTVICQTPAPPDPTPQQAP